MKPAVLAISIFIFSTGLASCSQGETGSPVSVVGNSQLTSAQPERKLDIYGKIVSMEGNELTVSQVDTSKDPTFNMSPEEKRKYMQSMDEAVRTALKETINAAVLGNVKLTVPVGIPMTKKTAQGPDAPSVEASLSDLKVGKYVSVWLSAASSDTKTAEFVKIAFSQ